MVLPSFLLLVLVPPALGGFLDGIQVPQVKLPPIKSPAELAQAVKEEAQAVKEEVAKSNPEQLAEDLKDLKVTDLKDKDLEGEDLKAKAEQELAGAQQEASAALEKGAGTVAGAKPQDVQSGLADAAGSEVVSAANLAAEAFQKAAKAAPTAKPEDIAKALHQGTSQVAQALNQTSLQAAELFHWAGPRAAEFLDRTGHTLANKLAGPDRVLPFDIILPPNVPVWSLPILCGGVLLLFLAVCGAYMGHLWRGIGVFKGHTMLSEALAPESSARTPVFQMTANQDALLMEG